MRIIAVFLSLVIALYPSLAFSNTSLGGWTITQQIAQGASTALNASKTAIINGANVVKTSTAKITPNASQVAKVLRGGAAGYALSVAVEQILGAGVDWVLDPVNNQIKWKEEGTLGGTYIFLCTEHINGCPTSSVMIHPTLKDPSLSFQYLQVCQSYAATLGGSMHSNTSSGTCIITVGGQNKFYGIGTRTIPAEEGEEKTLPLTVVAQKVIDNAESSTNNDHKVGAQVATTTAVQDMLANDAATQSDVQNQLDANEKTQTSEEAAAEATPKDPAAPDAGTNIKITFPVFCGWAPLVCEAAQSAIKFPTTVTNWWNTATQAISTAYTEFKQFFMTEPELDNPSVPEREIDRQEINKNLVQISARSCPADITFDVQGLPFGIEINRGYQMQPICDTLEPLKWVFHLITACLCAFMLVRV